tara:strand:- start:1284 stop:1898 length:615 start_codon:yes stop_codon:yes gene_type:complete
MDNDNSINLVEYFGKVLSYYKLYVPLIVLSLILGYVMTDKTPSYKASVFMTDTFGIVKPNDIKKSDIFRINNIIFNQFPNGVMKITHTSKDIDGKKYLEASLSEFESSYVLSKTRQNKIISDYFENNDGDALFQFTRIDDLRTYIFWRNYKDQKLFAYEWLPVESISAPLLSNMIKSSIAGVILSFFLVAVVIAVRIEEEDKHK